MRHKHKYVLMVAKSPFKIDFNGKRITGTELIGTEVVCSICGKENKRLSKKMGKIIANTEEIEFDNKMQECSNTYIHRIKLSK